MYATMPPGLSATIAASSSSRCSVVSSGTSDGDLRQRASGRRRSAPNPDAFEEILGKLNVMLAEWAGWPKQKIAALSAPVLLVIGDNDFVRIDRAADAAQLIPDAQLAVLPGTTHMSIIRRGAWLAPLIEARVAGG